MKKFSEFLKEGIADKKVCSDKEIVRLAMMAELEAINLYEQLAAKAQSPELKTILLDVAYEEKEHMGEFEELLYMIDDDYEEAQKSGGKEAKEKM